MTAVELQTAEAFDFITSRIEKTSFDNGHTSKGVWARRLQWLVHKMCVRVCLVSVCVCV